MFSPAEDQLRKMKYDPRPFLQSAGYDVPDELIGNPQAMVMHLIQTGQITGPIMQRIMPMIQKINGK